MNVLMAFATYSSGTETVSALIEGLIKQAGHMVTRKQVNEVTAQEIASYDVVILGSPSWDYDGKEGQPHQDFIQFMTSVPAQGFAGKKMAVFGLGDSTFTHFCGAVDVLVQFVKEKGGTLITDSLRIDGYFFNQANNNEKATSWTKGLLDKLTTSAV